MKRRRLLAVLLACSLLAGQTVWAAEDAGRDMQTEPAVQTEEETEETAQEPTKEPADAPGEDTDTTKDGNGSDELKSAEDSQKSEGEGFDWDSAEYTAMTVYMDLPQISTGYNWYEGNPEDYVAVVENPEI